MVLMGFEWIVDQYNVTHRRFIPGGTVTGLPTKFRRNRSIIVSPIKILINLGLLCWSTILIGLRKGWVSRKDVIDYAVDLLVNGSNEDETLR